MAQQHGNGKGKGRARGKGSRGEGGRGGGSGDLAAEIDALSKEMIQLLRHKGLPNTDLNGWTPMVDVVNALRAKPTRDSVEAVVQQSRRAGGDGPKRFELRNMKGQDYIRAAEKRSLESGSTATAQQRQTVPPMSPAPAPKQSSAAQEPRPSQERKQLGQAIADFNDPSHEGDDRYISLVMGESLTWYRHIPEDTGWAFGRTEKGEGWFPANFWAELPGSSPGAAAADGYNKPQDDDRIALQLELEEARAEIAKLKEELAREKKVSNQLRSQLEGTPKSAASEDTSRTPKQRLLTFLEEMLPDIRNGGLTYDITNRSKDARGRDNWMVKLSCTALDMHTEGGGTSKLEAEQNAAMTMLAQLQGSN